MALTLVRCTAERAGAGKAGHAFHSFPCEESGYEGLVRLAIVDRPAAAKSVFQWWAGADDWLTQRSSLRLDIHHNRSGGLEEYLSALEADLIRVRELLCPSGSVYVFADQRSSAHVRLLLDELFGRSNFLNEIIWAREAGLRPAGRFTRSHDTVFLYRMGRGALFNAGAAGRERGRLKSHMRRSVDAGRAYYTRISNGRTYRYFEDDIVSIGDVWTDIPELAAKDDERTGWEGQRPEALIGRMISSSSVPGDIVCDLMSGAGTTAGAAQALGRRALLSGRSPQERLLARRRLCVAGAESYEFCGPAGLPEGQPEAEASLAGDTVHLQLYRRSACRPGRPGTLLDDGLGSLEYWAAGRFSEGVFQRKSWAMRTRQQPTLPVSLSIGEGEGHPCIHLVDACGEEWFYTL